MKRKLLSIICCLGLIVSSMPHVFYAAIEEQPIIKGDQDTQTNQDQPAVQDEQVDPEIKEQQEKTKNEDVSNSEGLGGPSPRAVDANNVANAVVGDLQALDFRTTPEIANAIGPKRFSMADTLNKRLEISKRLGVSINEVTNEQAISELKIDYLQASNFGPSFEKVKNQLPQLLPSIVNNSSAANDQELINKIKQDNVSFMIGLTYLNRVYGFEMGGKNLFNEMITNPQQFGLNPDISSWVISIGKSGGDTLKLVKNATNFNVLMTNKITTATNVNDFLVQSLGILAPGTTEVSSWFVGASNALIEERSSLQDPSATWKLYDKLNSDPTYQNYILPILTVSKNSIFVISNPTTITFGAIATYVDPTLQGVAFNAKLDEFKVLLKKAATEQGNYVDFWFRIAKPELRSLLKTNRLVYDSLRIETNATQNASGQWSPKIGDNVALGIQEFITPMEMYEPFFQASGQASGPNIRYYMARALTVDGLSTYTHELSHILVTPLWLGGQGLRSGLDAEFYPRGLYETIDGREPSLELNMIFEDNDPNRVYNSSPTRFQTPSDLQSYMHNELDLIYTLDYMEADVVLANGNDVKTKWYHKWEQENDPRQRFNQGSPSLTHKRDKVRVLTPDEVGQLNTIDDLVNNNIVVSRYEIEGLKTTGVAPSNGYYIVPLFTSNYAAVTNDNGVSGDIMMRKQAYDLLGEYGYYEGMVPYISNQYLDSANQNGQGINDQFILQQISGGQYSNMTDFKLDMYHQRIDKINNIRPVTINWKGQTQTIKSYEEMKALMEQAVNDDLNNVVSLPQGWNNIQAKNTQVEQLKRAIHAGYLPQTKDFRETIYTEKDYIVEYQPNGAEVTGNMENQTMVIGKTATLNRNLFSKLGYKFSGWQAADGTTYQDGQEVIDLTTTPGEKVVLRAQWTPINYVVKFDANHPDAQGSVADMNAVYDQVLTLPDTQFSVKNFTFKGWSLSPNGPATMQPGSEVNNLTTTENRVVTLYAIWQENGTYNINYEINGGNQPAPPITQTPHEGEDVTIDNYRPTKPGYEFSGWEVRAPGSALDQSIVQPGQVLAGGFPGLTPGNDVMLSAQWTPITYEITFSKGEGVVGEMASINATYDQPITLPPNTFSKEGYSFMGWSTTPNGVVQFTDGSIVSNLTIDKSKPVVLYPVWQEKGLYTIKYETSGVTTPLTIPDQSAKLTKPVTISSEIPIKTGYTFKGWVIQSNARAVNGDVVQPGETIPIGIEDATEGAVVHLIPRWDVNNYTIEFYKPTDVIGSMEPIKLSYDQPITLPANTLTKPGFEFVGWATTLNGEVVYLDGVQVINLTSDNGATVTLFPVFKSQTLDPVEPQQPQAPSVTSTPPTQEQKPVSNVLTGVYNIVPITSAIILMVVTWIILLRRNK